MNSDETKQFIKEVFRSTVEDMSATEETYNGYFSKNYVQYVDGKKLSYDDFVGHMNALKRDMKSINVTFKHIIVEGDRAATVHLVNGLTKEGNVIEAQVNAIFKIQNKTIVMCDELTHLTKGNTVDSDLGSRQ